MPADGRPGEYRYGARMAEVENSGTETGTPAGVAEQLRRDPRPAVSRAALAVQYPAWGLATLGLLVAGLVVGVVSLAVLGATYDGCQTDPAQLVCNGRMHATVVALPVASLVVGLVFALIGGRLVAQRGHSPLVPTAVGWVVFVVGTVVAYLLGGVL